MIRRLNENVISKIAAGQIAVSPSSVVKELVENSLDANASTVTVLINSPFNFKVIDDGEGIPFKELPLAVERFSTSKIENSEDLLKLRTYGFRGEALHAISLFSRLVLKSRYYLEEIGGVIVVKGGVVENYEPIPFSSGTTVVVEDLYFNVPVRKKSVSRNEKQRMKNVVEDLAIANEGVVFKIDNVTYPVSSKMERIYRVTGKGFELKEKEFLTLFYKTKFDGSSGRVKKIFVNRRPVVSKEIAVLLRKHHIEEYILFIEFPPSEVDFNISPLKDKVVFKDLSNVLRNLESLLNKNLYFLPQFKTVQGVKEEASFNYGRLKLIGTDGTVAICEDGNYYYFFDIHLLHERVNYEMILEKLREGFFEEKRLSPPIYLDDYLMVKKLERLGVNVKRDGKKFIILSLPAIISREDVEDVLKGKEPESVASSACKNAVKAGVEFVSTSELEKLIALYMECKEKRVCPHGRLIFYRIKKRDILKKLGRL
ncbi:DNA mismatch repair endonuclease MutL [Desulfurobacterium indicum]|uniref:DNA mismatch repair endonuclease MutL n=1 Tax=Desulfurobacterium indicum TaxID=1914305 RepID=UPI00098F56CE|nr:DNA mismatch repair endonuclease MutL [Desulfurobacterium indicum]